MCLVSIHPLADVSSSARLGEGVRIDAFAKVEADVELGDFCTLSSGAILKTGVKAGSHNEFFEHSIIGGTPQHIARPKDIGSIVIGDHNVFRENVTIHRSLKPNTCTIVGNHNYLMAGAHLAHDVILGSNVIFANGSMLGGHVIIEDRAFISGVVSVHQFCRVGKLAMVGAHARVVQDVPPYMLIDGMSGLKSAYRIIYRHGLTWKNVLETLAAEFPAGPVAHLHAFLVGGTRGFSQERRAPPNAMLRLRVADDASTTTPAVRSKAG